MPSSLSRCCAAALVVAVLAPPFARAQDTTRVRADSTRADSSRAARDTLHATDTAQVRIRVPVPPPVLPPWRFQIDLGFQDVSGNANLTVFNTTVAIEHRLQDRYILNTKLEARYGKSNGVESQNYQALGFRFDWRPRTLVSPFVGFDIQRDPIRAIALRMQGGTGVNINIDARDPSRTFFSVGVVFDHQEYIQGVPPTGPTDDVRYLFRASAIRLIGTITRVEGLAKFQPAIEEFGNYLASVTASVRVAITRRMGITTKIEYRRDSRPALGVLPEDRAVTVALSFAW